MDEHPNAAPVRSAYEAVERGDLETFAAALDGHAAVLLETTMTLGDRRHTSHHVDIYRVRDAKATELQR